MYLSDKSGLVRKLLLYIALLVIPAFLIFSSLRRIEQREDIWYGGGYDPAYAYLYNSLNMATFKLSGHVDHPGTPMQVIGGVVLRVSYLIKPYGGETLADAVIQQPEYYLKILNRSVAWLSVLFILSIGLIVHRFTRNIWYALLIQSTPLLSALLLYNGFLRISQEVVLMIASISFGVFCLYWYYNAAKRKTHYYTDGFGIISGFGIASKIIFLPLMIIPFVLFRTRENRFRYIKATILSFIFFTIPIIPAYLSMGWWIIRLFTHSGIYGTGAATVIDTSSYFNDLKAMLIGEPFLMYTFLASAVFILILSILRFKGRKENDGALRILIAIFITQAAGFFITAKHPNVNYLLPYVCLSSCSMVIMITILSERIKLHWVRQATVAIVVTGLILIMGYRFRSQLSGMFTINNNKHFEYAWQLAMNKDAGMKHAVIGVNPGPSPIAAQFFANAYSRMRYADELENFYPDYYIFDTYSGRLVNWDNEPVSWKELAHLYQGNIRIIGEAGFESQISKHIEAYSNNLHIERIWSHNHAVVVWDVK